jgi:hypothetical protein
MQMHEAVSETTSPSTLLEQAAEWARGRNWLVRAPLLAWFAYMLVHYLRDPFYSTIFDGLNLGIHEMGHYLFIPFGEVMTVLGGSLLQCLAPLIAAYLFYRQKDFFAICIAFCWLSTNFFSVATYAADARSQALDLVSPGSDEPIHDWHWLLGHWGMMGSDDAIGRLLRLAAILSMLFGLATGAWLLLQMRNKPTTEEMT